MCQNTHSRRGVSNLFAKTHTSIASFGILGVKLKTRRLYALSGKGPKSFYTASVASGTWVLHIFSGNSLVALSDVSGIGGQFGGEPGHVLVGTTKRPVVWPS